MEIVYLDKAAKMTFVGGLKMNSPQTDIPISELYWSVYLPLDYSYFNFGGNVKLLKTKYQTMADVGGLLRQGVQGATEISSGRHWRSVFTGYHSTGSYFK